MRDPSMLGARPPAAAGRLAQKAERHPAHERGMTAPPRLRGGLPLVAPSAWRPARHPLSSAASTGGSHPMPAEFEQRGRTPMPRILTVLALAPAFSLALAAEPWGSVGGYLPGMSKDAAKK